MRKKLEIEYIYRLDQNTRDKALSQSDVKTYAFPVL